MYFNVHKLYNVYGNYKVYVLIYPFFNNNDMIRVNPCPNGIRDIFFLNECKEKVIGIFHH